MKNVPGIANKIIKIDIKNLQDKDLNSRVQDIYYNYRSLDLEEYTNISGRNPKVYLAQCVIVNQKLNIILTKV